jgi:phage terminase large subunit-like protein
MKKKVKLERLSPEEQEELASLLDEKVKEVEHNKIYTYFPDKGPLRRSLYPKHIEFFTAGGKHKPMASCPGGCKGKPHRERCIMSGNRTGKCLTLESSVDTVAGKKTIKELLEQNKPFEVWAWDGQRPVKAQASIPFAKPGLHECYRIIFADGSWIECADDHRLLTQNGPRNLGLGKELHFVHLSSIIEASYFDSLCQFSNDALLLGLFSSYLSHSILGNVLSKYRVNVQHCLNKALDWIYDLHFLNRIFYDAQLHLASENGVASVPLLGGARRHNHSSWHMDGEDSICQLQILHHDDRRSNQDARSLGLDQFYDVCTSNRILLSIVEAVWCQCLKFLPCCLKKDDPLAALSDVQPFAFLDHSRNYAFPFSILSGASISPFLLDDSNPIIAVNHIGRKQVFDFEVKQYHNYIAANMVHHNSEAGAYEITCHLTGEYPPWWKGKRFLNPISAWASGDTSQTTRDIIQQKLLGDIGNFGTGMIPKSRLVHTTTKGGLSGAVETIYVKHISGGKSELGLKSYDQGRIAFQGTSRHVIWLDEECKREIYTECLLRTTNVKGQADFGGIILITFTPLLGLTDIARDFLNMGEAVDGSEGRNTQYTPDPEHQTVVDEEDPMSSEL